MKKLLSVVLCICLILSVLPTAFVVFAAEKRPSYLFAIDAGHGGNDPGCTGADGRYESNDNLKIAQEVINLLNAQGQRTYLINREQKTQDRPIEANSINADFLISFHRDSSTSSSATGINIYTHEPSHIQQTIQPEKTYAPAEHPDKHTLDEKLVGNLYTYIKSTGTLPVSEPHYGSASAPIWEDYYINRLSNMPSCIIEFGFATNPYDNYVFDNFYKVLALVTAKALLATVGLEYVEVYTNTPEGSIQTYNEKQYYIINGAVDWDFSDEKIINDYLYIIEYGEVVDSASLSEGGKAGTSGDCKWIISKDTLKISGNGATDDYSETSKYPWDNTASSVIVKEGVTVIGENAFNGFESLSEVSLPVSITEIKKGAFDNCKSLEKVYYYGIKENFEKITVGENNEAFKNAEIFYVCDILGHSYDYDCSDTCKVCGGKRQAQHIYTNSCDADCNICGQIRTIEHTYCSDCDNTCDICGFKRETSANHSLNEFGVCVLCGERKYIAGDVNCDGVIDVIDAAKIRKHILQIEFINISVNPSADVNRDGVIDVIDAAKIRKHILQIELLPLF